jgi:hypothetical protein
MVAAYGSTAEAENLRAKAEVHARDYIYSTAPAKYHHFLVPDFPLGILACLISSRHLLTRYRVQASNL